MQKSPLKKPILIVLLILLTAGGISTALAVPTGPLLTIPSGIPADPNSTVTIPIIFTSNGFDISSVSFAIDYDETWLEYDPSIPNAIVFNKPDDSWGIYLNIDKSRTDSEIGIAIVSGQSPPTTLVDGTIIEIKLRTLNAPGITTAYVNFSTTYPVSFGDINAEDVPGSWENGSVKIGDEAKIFIPLIVKSFGEPAASPTASKTATSTSTATTTATATSTGTATSTYTPRPTRTPFWQTRTPTHTPTKTPTPTEDLCSNIILNKGFEDTSDKGDDGWGWELPITEYTARFSTNRPRVGEYSLETGIIDSGDNVWSYSSGYQAVTVPNGISSATLSFWNYTISNDAMVRWLPTIFWNKVTKPPSLDEPATYDMQYMAIEDLTVGGTAQIRWGGGTYNNQYWDYQTLDLLSLGYGGHVIRIWFSSFNDGWGGITSMYVDDVRLEVCE